MEKVALFSCMLYMRKNYYQNYVFGCRIRVYAIICTKQNQTKILYILYSMTEHQYDL